MFCPRCGKLISDDSKECPYCMKVIENNSNANSSLYAKNFFRCDGCGRQIPNDLDKCPYCGKRFGIASSGVNVIGIIGFVLSIICLFFDPYFIFSIVAFILSCVGLSQSDEHGLKGLCVTGVVLSLIEILLRLILLIYPSLLIGCHLY